MKINRLPQAFKDHYQHLLHIPKGLFSLLQSQEAQQFKIIQLVFSCQMETCSNHSLSKYQLRQPLLPNKQLHNLLPQMHQLLLPLLIIQALAIRALLILPVLKLLQIQLQPHLQMPQLTVLLSPTLQALIHLTKQLLLTHPLAQLH